MAQCTQDQAWAEAGAGALVLGSIYTVYGEVGQWLSLSGVALASSFLRSCRKRRANFCCTEAYLLICSKQGTYHVLEAQSHHAKACAGAWQAERSLLSRACISGPLTSFDFSVYAASMSQHCKHASISSTI